MRNLPVNSTPTTREERERQYVYQQRAENRRQRIQRAHREAMDFMNSIFSEATSDEPNTTTEKPEAAGNG